MKCWDMNLQNSPMDHNNKVDKIKVALLSDDSRQKRLVRKLNHLIIDLFFVVSLISHFMATSRILR